MGSIRGPETSGLSLRVEGLQLDAFLASSECSVADRIRLPAVTVAYAAAGPLCALQRRPGTLRTQGYGLARSRRRPYLPATVDLTGVHSLAPSHLRASPTPGKAIERRGRAEHLKYDADAKAIDANTHLCNLADPHSILAEGCGRGRQKSSVSQK